jgi:hypothetical protein
MEKMPENKVRKTAIINQHIHHGLCQMMTRPEGKWALFVGATRFVLSAFWLLCPSTVFLSTRHAVAAHRSRR